MHTFKNGKAEDSLHRAYGHRGQELLSQSYAAQWVEDLGHVHGFTLFSEEAGVRKVTTGLFLSKSCIFLPRRRKDEILTS